MSGGFVEPPREDTPLVCEVCRQNPAVKKAALGRTRSGAEIVLSVCEGCEPIGPVETKQKRRRKKTKNRRAATDYSDMVLTILYRQAGGTADQVARWMLQMTDNFDYGRTDSYSAALEAARRALRTMREAGQVEALSVRTPWMKGKRGGKAGRRVDYYRLRREGDSIIEAGVLCGVDGTRAKRHYARPWMGGGHVHAAHRAEVQLLFVEEAEHLDGIEVDPERCTCETREEYPLIGAKLATVDAAGEDITGLRKNARRKYASVVPDAEIVVVWEDAEYAPVAPPSGGAYLDPAESDEDSHEDSHEDSFEQTGEEMYA